MSNGRTATCAIVIAIALSSSMAAVGPSQGPTGSPAATDERYTLQPGDVIDVKFFYNGDLNETLPIRPDGRISLQLVDDVPAAGRTPSELRAELIRRYAAVLRQPEVAVIVKQLAPRRLYIGGEVRTPSLLLLDGPTTLMQAIFQAGGFTRGAKPTDIVVLRYRGQPQPEFIKVDLEPVLKLGQASADMVLQPLDIVWVPKTKIAKVDDFMAQYVRDLVPVPLSLGISYVFGELRP